MKYWFYSEGNILGPYEPAELLALPAFAEESLVCAETCTGDNPGDWRPASQVGEIASALSVGAGRAVAAGSIYASYESETGFNSSVSYFENREPGPSSSYGDLLDAIDNVLGSYKEGPAAPGKPAETDYDLAEKFDIRLSRIQEELEAARWEKNLLLEKIRLHDQEEKKNKTRIEELEARLRGERLKTVEGAQELEQVRHLADLKQNAETLRQIEEIRKEELSLKEEAGPAKEEGAAQAQAGAPAKPAAIKAEPVSPEVFTPAAGPRAAETKKFSPQPVEMEKISPQAAQRESAAPVIETRSFKTIKPASEIKLGRTVGEELKEEAEDPSLTSRKLKSLGQTQPPAYVYGSHYDKPLSGPEAAPPGAFRPEAAAPLPQQAGGVVFDFTVVTSRPAEVQQFRIEPRQAEPLSEAGNTVKSPAFDPGPQPAPRPAPAPQPYQFQPVQPVMSPEAQPAPFQYPQPVMSSAAQPAPAQPLMEPAPAAATVPAAQMDPATPAQVKDQPATSAGLDKTQRLAVLDKKGKPEVTPAQKTAKKGGRTAFLVILLVFGSIAAGGLGYFFMGEGVSFSEFSMLNLGGKKKPASMASQLESKPEGEAAAVENTSAVAEVPAAANQAAAPEAQTPAAAPQPANENIKKALDIVKNYKLSGGRGVISGWFANSFMSNSGGANEEWTATPLHGDILVVQYRLLRPRQDPLIYQFEVDAAKQDIVRGINNNAIELLDFSSKAKTVSAAPARKAAPKKARKPAGRGEIPILPLPDAPSGQPGEQDPTGFENPQADSAQVRYLKAQESDEELF